MTLPVFIPATVVVSLDLQTQRLDEVVAFDVVRRDLAPARRAGEDADDELHRRGTKRTY
eukprot:COSAG02_NODE_18089_length_961_cov_7.788863_2_plen_59_part_00